MGLGSGFTTGCAVWFPAGSWVSCEGRLCVGAGVGGGVAFEFTDLVTKQCRFFEQQVLGGFEHFGFEFADGFGEVKVRLCVAEELIGLAGLGLAVGEAMFHGAGDAAGGDTVESIKFQLFLAAVLGGGEEFFYAIGQDVGVEDDLAVEVPGGAAGGLD